MEHFKDPYIFNRNKSLFKLDEKNRNKKKLPDPGEFLNFLELRLVPSLLVC